MCPKSCGSLSFSLSLILVGQPRPDTNDPSAKLHSSVSFSVLSVRCTLGTMALESFFFFRLFASSEEANVYKRLCQFSKDNNATQMSVASWLASGQQLRRDLGFTVSVLYRFISLLLYGTMHT